MMREGVGYRRDRRHRKAQTSNKESSRAIWFEGSLLYFKNDHGLIVEDFCTGSELVCCFKDCVHNLPCGAAGVLGNYVLHAATAKRFIIRVAGVNNAITKKGEY